jgi:two-component system, cell cycle sensor histidine kinase and response regulator CckA
VRAKLRIIILEDDAGDAATVEAALRGGGLDFAAQTVTNREDFIKAIKDTAPDVVLSDCVLPGFQGREALALFRLEHPDLPFIAMSGLLGDEQVAELMRAGATDFISKNHLEKLVPSVKRALRELAERREQRQAELLRQSSEARFRALFESAGSGIGIEDLHGKIIQTNRALQQMLGYEPTELLTVTRRDFTHTQDLKEETAHFKRLLAGKSDHYRVEKRFVRKDGRIFWGRLTVSMVRDAAGAPQFTVAMIEDITERQRAEETHMQYAAIVEFSNDAIVSKTLDGIIFNWNPAAARLFGYLASEANGRPITLITPVEREAEEQHTLEGMKRGEFIDNFETTRLRKDGLVIHVSVTTSPIKDVSGRIIGASSIYRDITDRKRAEEVLRKSQAENQKLAAFPQFNPNPVLELATDGSVTYSNEAARHMAESLGKPQLSEFLPPETPAIVKECLLTRESRLRLTTVIRGRTISWSFFPVPEIGVVHCYAGDITERQNLEAQLRQSQKMESVGLLAGGVAHDFNNILTVIQGHNSLLASLALSEDALDSARQIALAADRAANLTRQLLTFSRRQILQPKNLDLNEVVSNMTKMLRRLLGEDITLQVNYASSLPLVHADPGMMEQVLMNLSINSRDAMPKGGKLLVDTSSVKIDDAAARKMPGASPGQYVCLTVRDTGRGIPPEVMPHIFEPFFTTKDVGKGTGLGLATVYGIVQQHRGSINVTSKVGVEAVFEIYLPAVAGTASAREAAPLPPEIRGGNETLLIVEDEGPLRQLVKRVLERYGYRVLEANSGVDALPIWLQYKDQISLLLTDMVMPHGVSGRELAERLRGDKPGLKVIYSSGYSLAVVGGDMVLRDGLNFLQKPYDPIKLARAVRDCLDA